MFTSGPSPAVADRFHYVGVQGFADVLPLAHDRLPAYEWSRLRPPLHGRMMASGSYSSPKASMSPEFHVSYAARMNWMFSCDIAYSDSPTASRASAWSQK